MTFPITIDGKTFNAKVNAVHVYFQDNADGDEMPTHVISDGQRTADRGDIVNRSITVTQLSKFADAAQRAGITNAQALAFVRELGQDPWMDEYDDSRQEAP